MTNVTDEGQITGIIDQAIEPFGRFDILYNNAAAGSGLGSDGDVITTPDSKWN